MKYRIIFPIFLIFLSVYLTTASARRNKKKDESVNQSEIQLNTDTPNEGERALSSELQVLKDFENNSSVGSAKAENDTVTPRPKHHRRKNNHHRRGNHTRRGGQTRGRLHNKHRTRPTDILTADDDDKPLSVNSESGTQSQTASSRIPVKNKSRPRASRHLDMEREFTNGHSGHHHKHHHHHNHRQNRRRRFHHKKHGNIIDSPTTVDNNQFQQPLKSSIAIHDDTSHGITV